MQQKKHSLMAIITSANPKVLNFVHWSLEALMWLGQDTETSIWGCLWRVYIRLLLSQQCHASVGKAWLFMLCTAQSDVKILPNISKLVLTQLFGCCPILPWNTGCSAASEITKADFLHKCQDFKSCLFNRAKFNHTILVNAWLQYRWPLTQKWSNASERRQVTQVILLQLHTAEFHFNFREKSYQIMFDALHFLYWRMLGAPGGAAPLSHFFFKIMHFLGRFKGKTYFEHILGSGPLLGSKLHWGPLTNILDPPLPWDKGHLKTDLFVLKSRSFIDFTF